MPKNFRRCKGRLRVLFKLLVMSARLISGKMAAKAGNGLAAKLETRQTMTDP